MKYEPYIRIAEGAEHAVLLIHGLMGSPCQFRDLIPVIPESWSVYNILLDGHGKQVADLAHSSMEKWKTQISRQLDEILLTHKDVLIVGHSMGNQFAIEEAVRHPDRVKALFLLSTPLSIFVTPRAAVNILRVPLGHITPGTLSEQMAEACGVHLTPRLWKYLTWVPRFHDFFRENKQVIRLLPQLTTPTRSYQCDGDEIITAPTLKLLSQNECITNIFLHESGHYGYSAGDVAFLQREFLDLIASLS